MTMPKTLFNNQSPNQEEYTSLVNNRNNMNHGPISHNIVREMPEIIIAPYDSLREPKVPSECSEEEYVSPKDSRKKKLLFLYGCILAFLSGLSITVNNFVTKEAALNFGEILAVRGVIQTLVMAGVLLVQGLPFIPRTNYQRFMVALISLVGALTILSGFACVKFMPVGDGTTLMFTVPLFTMIFAALFLKQRLTIIKSIAGIVLMVGIVLVTKPPFLFPSATVEPSADVPATVNPAHVTSPVENNSSLIQTLIADYLDREYELFSLATITADATNVDEAVASAGNSLYFVGAIIALSSAICSATNAVLVSNLGDDVSTNIQLFWIGVACILVSPVCMFIDENDRIFSAQIVDIRGAEWGGLVAVSLCGLFGFYCTLNALNLIPPATASTLRTSQIIVAFIAQVIMVGVMPAFIDVAGAGLVFLAAMAITFEPRIRAMIAGVFSCIIEALSRMCLRKRGYSDIDMLP